jgi:DNA end-binding protein Ku
MQIQQFVKTDELPAVLFERPYFVAPKDGAQAKALAIMRKALDETGTCGIGEIAFSGREHLVAIGAPPDPKQKGLMLYILRYAEELRDSKSVFSGTKETTASAQEVSLAKQLINGSTSKFDLSAYKDDYETAVLKLVNAKRKGKPLPEPEPEKPRAKVVNIMDALRESLANAGRSTKGKKTSTRKKAA